MTPAELATAEEGGGEVPVATRARIVEAASAMFLRLGYDAVPMSHVAKAAGVTTPALYWHFASKEDLYCEVLETGYREFFVEVVERVEGVTARERLVSYVRAFVELQLQDRESAMQFGLGQLGSRLPEEKQKEITLLQRQYDQYLKGILRQGIDEGVFEIPDVSITTLAIHTMCEYAFAWFKPARRRSVGEVAELHADLALRMASSPG